MTLGRTAGSLQYCVRFFILSAPKLDGATPLVAFSHLRLSHVALLPFARDLQSTGHELYLRDPRASYGLPLGKPLLWKDVAEVARKRGETAIGFTTPAPVASNGSMELGHGNEAHLGVIADSEVILSEGDKLVVVALD